MRWQLQDAKAKLSELVKRAEREGPQEITVHGELKAVLLSREAYEGLTGKKPTLVQLLRGSPLYGLEIEIERDRGPERKTAFDSDKLFE